MTSNATGPVDVPAGGRPRLAAGPLLPVLLLVLASLPDGLIPPVLKGLVIDRFSVGPTEAHGCMSVNLLGAFLAVPLIGRLRRLGSVPAIIAGAAAANGALLAAMAGPVGFIGLLLLRLVEGGADLLVIAILFDLVGRAGPIERRGRRLGLAGMALMCSIGLGLLVGGVVGEQAPLLSLTTGALVCLCLAATVIALARPLRLIAGREPGEGRDPDGPGITRRLWPVLMMSFSDRAMSGLLTATVPLYLASAVQASSRETGTWLGTAVLLMALGTWPAGILGDRIGHGRLRVAAALAYATAIGLIPVASSLPTAMLMILVGLAGAALLASGLSLAARSGLGASAMGAYHAAGNGGNLVGIVGSALLLGTLGVDREGTVIVAFAAGHGLVTVVTAWALLRRRSAVRRERSGAAPVSRRMTAATAEA